jgi:hypothetical protein
VLDTITDSVGIVLETTAPTNLAARAEYPNHLAKSCDKRRVTLALEWLAFYVLPCAAAWRADTW